MRDAWFWSRVLGLCVWTVALCAPEPPGTRSPHHSAAEPSATAARDHPSTEPDRPSASRGHRDIAESWTVDERSSSSLESTSLTTESSSLSSTTEVIYSTQRSDGTSNIHSSDETSSTQRSDGTSSTLGREETSSTQHSDRTSNTHSSDGTDSTHRRNETNGTHRRDEISSTQRSDRTSNTQRSDGTNSTQRSDGTSSTQRSDGTSRTQRTEGTSSTHRRDEISSTHRRDEISSTQRSDRASNTQRSDGTNSTQRSNGTSSTQRSDGTSSTQRNNGTSSTQSSDGTNSTQRSDGTNSTQRSDRTSGTQRSEGTSSTQRNNGTSSTQRSDGTSSTHSGDGTSSTHSSDETSSTQHSDGTSSTQRSDGTSSTQRNNGTSSTQRNNGTSSTHSSDETSSTHSNEGKSSTQRSDGTSSTQRGDETSSTQRTEGTSSTHSSDGTSSTDSRDEAPVSSPAVSWKPRVWTWTETEHSTLIRDSPDSTLRLGDITDFISQTETDGTYTSTTMSRAGERTLLSVTSFLNNNTSSVFTEDSISHEPPATWALSLQTVETEDYTRTISVPKTEVISTEHETDSFRKTLEMELPASSTEMECLSNSTENQQAYTSEVTFSLIPSAAVTEHSTSQTEYVISSTPPMLSPAVLTTDVVQESASYETSTEVSTEAHSLGPRKQEGTEAAPFRSEEDTGDFGLMTAPPTVSNRTDAALTEMTLVTDVFLTTTVTVTERFPLQDEANPPTTISTTSAPLVHTSTPKHTTISSTTAASRTQATASHTILPTRASPPEQQTATAFPSPSIAPSSTPRPSPSAPTRRVAVQLQTTGASPLEVTTAARSRGIAATSTDGTTTQSTETQTTGGRAGGEKAPPITTPATVIQPPPPPQRNPCVSNPCLNGGMCVSYAGRQFTCHCQRAWTGPTCNEDVNECERDPCPVGSRCVNTRGSLSCECPLGFDLEDGRTCTRAKTFLGTFSVNRQPHEPAVFKSATMHEIQREIIQLLNASLSVLGGYSRSTLSRKEEGEVRILAVNMFSTSAEVTSSEVYNSIQMSLANCSSSLVHCRMMLHHQLTYHVESLCVAQQTQCDTERSACTDSTGTAICQCLQGYYKHNPEDLACLECGDGYKLENGTCVPCVFGFGGFNCGNFYKLIAVVVSPAGGGILLILIIVLIVTCLKRDKNDINKIIFKSGDLQMSPYTDFPKTNRISMEWGRETIEMQENGSTKNLLQMTDIYYSPALRNADLERNGLYPFTGLPGSRHSCIYPAQWNPSFTSDDSRRRDYF